MTTRCPNCGADIQRTPEGKLIDGLNAHLAVVHQIQPRQRLPVTRKENA